MTNVIQWSDLSKPDPMHDADVVYGAREPPDWGPTIRAEPDPKRVRILQDIEEFDKLTELRAEDGCTLYRWASTDLSILSRDDALKYIADLLENLEIWQHLARRVCITDYRAPRELKIHTERWSLGK